MSRFTEEETTFLRDFIEKYTERIVWYGECTRDDALKIAKRLGKLATYEGLVAKQEIRFFKNGRISSVPVLEGGAAC